MFESTELGNTSEVPGKSVSTNCLPPQQGRAAHRSRTSSVSTTSKDSQRHLPHDELNNTIAEIIAELYQERARVDRVIASLAQLAEDASSSSMPAPRRGRKFMTAEERQTVSARMREYWARRKLHASGSG